jgi:anti-sigma regulatory factor (Ser/Thr protein kinase)
MTPTNHWPLASYLELVPLPSATPRARLHTRQLLQEWDLCDLGESAELVASELITNAIRASRSVGGDHLVRFWLFSDRTRVVIDVWDTCPDPPQPAHTGPTDEDGRGLLLVEAMTTFWDWYSRDGGKVVRAILQFNPQPERNPEAPDSLPRSGESPGSSDDLSPPWRQVSEFRSEPAARFH